MNENDSMHFVDEGDSTAMALTLQDMYQYIVSVSDCDVTFNIEITGLRRKGHHHKHVEFCAISITDAKSILNILGYKESIDGEGTVNNPLPTRNPMLKSLLTRTHNAAMTSSDSPFDLGTLKTNEEFINLDTTEDHSDQGSMDLSFRDEVQENLDLQCGNTDDANLDLECVNIDEDNSQTDTVTDEVNEVTLTDNSELTDSAGEDNPGMTSLDQPDNDSSYGTFSNEFTTQSDQPTSNTNPTINRHHNMLKSLLNRRLHYVPSCAKFSVSDPANTHTDPPELQPVSHYQNKPADDFTFELDSPQYNVDEDIVIKKEPLSPPGQQIDQDHDSSSGALNHKPNVDSPSTNAISEHHTMLKSLLKNNFTYSPDKSNIFVPNTTIFSNTLTKQPVYTMDPDVRTDNDPPDSPDTYSEYPDDIIIKQEADYESDIPIEEFTGNDDASCTHEQWNNTNHTLSPSTSMATSAHRYLPVGLKHTHPVISQMLTSNKAKHTESIQLPTPKEVEDYAAKCLSLSNEGRCSLNEKRLITNIARHLSKHSVPYSSNSNIRTHQSKTTQPRRSTDTNPSAPYEIEMDVCKVEPLDTVDPITDEPSGMVETVDPNSDEQLNTREPLDMADPSVDYSVEINYTQNSDGPSTDPSSGDEYSPCSKAKKKRRTKLKSKSATKLSSTISRCKPYTCSQCDYVAVNARTLWVHMRQEHSEKAHKLYSCGLCTYQTEESSFFEIHCKSHMDTSSRLWFEGDDGASWWNAQVSRSNTQVSPSNAQRMREYRERIRNDPQRYALYLDKERARCARRKSVGTTNNDGDSRKHRKWRKSSTF